MAENKEQTKWLLGKLEAKFSESKLPRKIDILKVIYFQQSELKATFQESLQLVVNKVIEIWKCASIPTILRHRVVSKIRQFAINEYEAVKKNRFRKTSTQKLKEKNLKLKLQELLDISSRDIENVHLKKFLCDQRTTRKLKIDCIKGLVNENSQATSESKCKNVQKTVKNSTENAYNGDKWIEDESSACDSDNSGDEDYKCPIKPVVLNKRKKKFTKKSSITNKIINSSDVLSSLDRTKITSNEFLFVAAAIAKECKEDISKCALSTSTLRRKRIQNRSKIAKIVKEEFSSSIKQGLVVHWDGKKMADSTNPNKQLRKRKIERLGVVVTGGGKQKTLSINKLKDGTGKSAAETVFNVVKEWKADQNIIGISTDTTSINTGNKKGACMLFEKQMEKKLLYFPCRHHIYEVFIGGVFELIFGESKSPENCLFQKFQDIWPSIDKQKVILIEPVFLKSALSKRLQKGTVTTLKKILSETNGSKYIPRGDYKELIQLCLIFLGEKIPGFTFKLPGAFGNARWMVKVIYAFKMYFFRRQFPQETDLEEQLREFCLFSSLIYVKAWIECPISTDAACNDLELIKNIVEYRKLNEDISARAMEKFGNHLWYLGSELVVLSLFSDKVSTTVKQQIIDKINHYDTDWSERDLRLQTYENLHKKSLIHLFGYPSKSALCALGIPAVEFMFSHKAKTWNDSSVFLEGKQFVTNIQVVNDPAERSVAFMTRFNSSLTYNEEEKQNLLQVVEAHRKRIPKPTKKNLISYQSR